MVGHKYNLKELVTDLKAEGIRHTTTEFCQGRVTRWGLAWTYQDYDFSMLSTPINKARKKCTPIASILPELPDQKNDSSISFGKIKSILTELKIIYNIISKRKNELSLSLTAHSNTWSNQRRKRRLMKHIEKSQAKQPKIELDKQTSEVEEKVLEQNNIEGLSKKNESSSTDLVKNGEEIIVQGIMKLFMKNNHLHIELEYLNGTAGKEGLHQIMQYIKNNWK